MAHLNLRTYDAGPYAPVDTEHAEPLTCTVTGSLPPELRGSLVQNSANAQFAPPWPAHWFDGDGMVHGIELGDGIARYRSRWVRTAAFHEEGAAGKALHAGILMPFEPGAEEPDKNTANTDLVWWNGRLLALWWLGGDAYRLSVPDLGTEGVETFAGTAPCGVAAHAKVDPRTGELVFFDYNPYRRPYLRYAVASADGTVVHCTDVALPRPSLLHDIAITEHHTVLMDLPMYWDPARLAQGKRRVRFDRERPSRWGVVPRHGSNADIRWFEGPPCYVYHTVNAWEEPGSSGAPVLTMIGCRIADPIPTVPHEQEPHIPRLYFLRLEPYLTKWTFDLGTGQMTEEQLDDVPSEFPRMNDRHLGRPSRFAWHPRVARAETLLFDAAIRYDLQRGTSAVHEYGDGRFGGETVFAPRPGATDEDDGWVLVFVSDLRGGSELLVLDGRDVAAGPVARVHIPVRVPVGFHAEWVPAP